MKFRKMHGCGNDYIVINAFKEDISKLDTEKISFLCKSHFGIGSEGLLLALPSNTADFRMRMFNIDGSEAEMCGNGIRCISKFAFEEGIVKNNTFNIETKSGIKKIELIFENDEVSSVKVDMGQGEILKNNVEEYDLFCISVGNPHAIMIVEDLKNFPVDKIGYEIENHKAFPNRTNVEFAEIVNRNLVNLRVWERGCGETFACGTGSCATAFALYKNNLIDDSCLIKLKGGDLYIEIKDNNIFMTGNAVNVFNGEIII